MLLTSPGMALLLLLYLGEVGELSNEAPLLVAAVAGCLAARTVDGGLYLAGDG